MTDVEDYTISESITFFLRTNQEISHATSVLVGLVQENIYYVFDIEVSATLLSS